MDKNKLLKGDRVLTRYLKKRIFKPENVLIKEGDKVIYTPDYYYAKHKGKEGIVSSLGWYEKDRSQQIGVINFEDIHESKEFRHGGEVKIYEDKYYKIIGYIKSSRNGLIGFLTKGEIKEILEEIDQSEIPKNAHVEYKEEYSKLKGDN